jgi:hypothetical protein
MEVGLLMELYVKFFRVKKQGRELFLFTSTIRMRAMASKFFIVQNVTLMMKCVA